MAWGWAFSYVSAADFTICSIAAINKPMGMSSAQVIRDCQTQFNTSKMFEPLISQEVSRRSRESRSEFRRRGAYARELKVKLGHGGTLDPLATGVLILGVGRGTKQLQSFLGCKKTYETVVLFGVSTDTYDRVGRVLKRAPYDHITRKMVEDALGSFRGKFQQMPPLYSALKMNGKPLYEYAREGKPIPREIQTREVEVTEIELVEWMEPGTHNHRWPTEEASSAEQTVAEQVWRAEKQQQSMKKLTDEEEREEQSAFEAHVSFKRKAEERQDELVIDAPGHKRRRQFKEPPMMSGALGSLPETSLVTNKGGKGSNLIPPPPPANTPPPWDGKGPPAAKIRLTVSSGFYVRSFCHDLGEKVGSRAVMAELCRSQQGGFKVGTPTILEYEDLDKGEEVWGPQVARLLSDWAKRQGHVSESEEPAAERPEPAVKSPSATVAGADGAKVIFPSSSDGEESKGGMNTPRIVVHEPPATPKPDETGAEADHQPEPAGHAVAEEAKVKEANVEEPKVEEPKAEEPKAEEPKAGEGSGAIQEEPAVDGPKCDVAHADSAKA